MSTHAFCLRQSKLPCSVVVLTDTRRPKVRSRRTLQHSAKSSVLAQSQLHVTCCSYCAVDRGIRVHPCSGSWRELRVWEDDVTGHDRICQHTVAAASGGPGHLSWQSRPCRSCSVLLCASHQVGTDRHTMFQAYTRFNAFSSLSGLPASNRPCGHNSHRAACFAWQCLGS